MIKVKIKKNLQEALLSFSKQAQKDITDFVQQTLNSGEEGRKVFQIPLSDLIYKSKAVLSGLPFLYYLNLNNSSLGSETSEKILNKTLSLVVRVYNDKGTGTMAGYGSSTKKGKSRLLIVFYAPNIKQIESVPNLVRHELQHMTQNLNDICIAYDQSLKQVGDPKKVSIIPLSKEITKFGLGKQKTGITTRGLSSDIEYETYLSDAVNSFYNKLKTKHKQSVQDDIKSIGEHATAVKYLNLLFKDWRNKNEYFGLNKILTTLLKVRPKETPKDMLRSLEDLLKQA